MGKAYEIQVSGGRRVPVEKKLLLGQIESNYSLGHTWRKDDTGREESAVR